MPVAGRNGRRRWIRDDHTPRFGSRRYYPDEEVYFVPETRVYWWSVGGEWRSGPHVPDGLKLGASINLGVDGRDPWRHHEMIVKQYPHRKQEDRDREDKHDRDDKHRDHD